MIVTADMLDQQGMALIQSSYSLEEQIQATQEDYESGLKDIPTLEPVEVGAGPAAFVQRTPEEGYYSERINLNLGGRLTEALPSFLTGENHPDRGGAPPELRTDSSSAGRTRSSASTRWRAGTSAA